MRMLQIGGRFDFTQKAIAAQYQSQLGLQNLEGNPAIVTDISREIDRSHPTGADFALDGVAAGERRIELGSNIHHYIDLTICVELRSNGRIRVCHPAQHSKRWYTSVPISQGPARPLPTPAIVPR